MDESAGREGSNCPRCGAELFTSRTGEQRCGCGWKSKPKGWMAILPFLITAVILVSISAWIYAFMNYRILFPDKNRANALLASGKESYSHGLRSDGIAEMQKATEYDPRNADVWAELAHALAIDGRVAPAAEAMAKACEYAPEHYQYEIELGNLYGMHGDFQASIKHLEKAAQMAPDDPVAQENLVVGYERANDLDKALHGLDRLTTKAPKKTALWIHWAELLKSQGKNSEQLDVLERGLKANPDSAELQLLLGREFVTAGRGKEAVEHLKTAAQLQPMYAQAVKGMIDAAERGQKKKTPK